MIINTAQAEHFRRIALHPNTNSNEARNASMMFCRCLASSDLKQHPIRTIAINLADRGELDSVKEMLRRAQAELANLKRDLLAEQVAHSDGRRLWESHCAGFKEVGEHAGRLMVENERLRAEAAKREEVGCSSDTGTQYVSFKPFSDKAEQKFGRKRWMSAFAFEIGVSLQKLRAWKTVDLFPAALAMKLEDLSEDQTKPASRQTWTTQESTRLKAVLADGATNLVAAKKLSAEFGRVLHESSIVGARRRIRLMGFEDAMRTDSTDPEPTRGKSSAPRTGKRAPIRKSARQHVTMQAG